MFCGQMLCARRASAESTPPHENRLKSRLDAECAEAVPSRTRLAGMRDSRGFSAGGFENPMRICIKFARFSPEYLQTRGKPSEYWTIL
jgi:hypothetical protein